METIEKINCLETAKNRLENSGLTCLSGTSYVYDRIVSDTSLQDVIPLVDNVNGEKILRYKNLMNQYYWLLNDFIPSCTYKKLCLRGENLILVNYNVEDITPFEMSAITEDRFNVVDYSGLSIGDIVCDTSLFETLINRFTSYEKAKEFYFLAKDLMDNGNYYQYGSDSIPYLDFTVYLEQEFNDFGYYECGIEFWVPGKKYYIGDCVYYSDDGSIDNIKAYELVSGSAYDLIEVPKSMYDVYNGNKEQHNDKYYIKEYYYCGYHDAKTMLCYFDEPNNKHWDETIVGVVSTGITGETMSMLNVVKRKKRDIDDGNKTLPFNLHYNIIKIDKDGNEDPNGEYEKRVLDSGTTELMYVPGFLNQELQTDGSFIGCEIENIEFFRDYSFKDKICEFNSTNHTNSAITTTDLNLSDESQLKIVRFTYHISEPMELISINNNQQKWQKVSDGIKYVETYDITIDTYDCTIDGTKYKLKYFNFNDLLSANKSATISYDNSGTTITNCNYLYKDDSTIGLHDVIENINADIDRGKAIAFEKHNALGECNTMQDLEHYHNDFFEIGKQ